MPFINNNKLTEIREQSKNGNEKALMILQAMRKGTQEDVDRLVDDYYSVAADRIPDSANDVNENLTEIKEELPPQELVAEEAQLPVNENEVIDLTDVLNTELDGLLDMNEIEDSSFSDFLGNKKRDLLRSRKGTEYFSAYDPIGRENYLNQNINDYKGKFDERVKSINRRHSDMDTALNNYTQGINDYLDDDINLDMNLANNAYDDLTGNESVMNSFTRHWDENDKNLVMGHLKSLIEQFGKQNVIAALNTLRNDNNNYRDFLNNQIDTEVSRYSKSIEKLLK